MVHIWPFLYLTENIAKINQISWENTADAQFSCLPTSWLLENIAQISHITQFIHTI